MKFARRAIAALMVFAALLVPGASASAATLKDAVAAVKKDAARGKGSNEVRLARAIHSYVWRNVTSPRLAKLPPSEIPTSVREALRKRAGSCGTKTQVALAIADRVGLRARPIEFYYAAAGEPASHIFWEAHAGGRWRVFDTQMRATFHGNGKQLSFARLWQLPAQERVGAAKNARAIDGWWQYLTNEPDVVFDGVGTVRAWQVNGEWPTVPNRPSFIGVAPGQGEGRWTDLDIQYDGVTRSRLIVEVAGITCGSGVLIAQSQITSSAVVDPTTRTAIVAVRGPTATLSMANCAVVVTNVRQG